ncbi:Mitotic spindle checkpoint component mad2 OS=Schizosaccharomyces pombe (strain 972 / ATCC 24843) GN=mad2 PE=1 SV=1 [Rhizoctonia solani AG-1 IB]|uniref:Mitotic spindle checkpoint component mad2 n=1 Tax=Thanatephorus cucumeris (strain AG1-IB / isolate 7/3/14) TaxID=1108050 RepID=A0A0B7FCF7_THACB|nr:Mitotic spindle checkpoint component mad2 OS=Schizosaccharomyces pombe (strain 972 / ATCC 24843) GN=mad2 PE=1 SV=1 [Rhizoctonia solani AG-1 IB]
MSAPNTPPDLTASGSPATIIEFLYYAVNSILFYRGVYESEDFRAVNKYEQDLVLVRDGEVTQFLDRFFKQVEEWLSQKLIHRVILVIVSKDTGKTLERWVFNLEPHDGPAHLDKIQHKIQATLKQLKATIPIFPDIKEPTIFNLLAVKKDEPKSSESSTSEKWIDAHSHAIPAEIRDQTAMRGFNTSDAKVDMNVVYIDQ